jgi:hypothetical protein
MVISALTVSLVVKPVTVINIAISMVEFTLSACLVLMPETFVSCAVRPHLDTIPLLALA